jgi:hypothetical protein
MTRICVSWVAAVALTGLLFLITNNPWASVFACGVGLGWLLLDYSMTLEALRARQMDIVELEKQIVQVVMCTALHDMSATITEMEASHRMACLRPRVTRQLSSSSL